MPLSQDDFRQVASEIADILGEKFHGPRKLVQNVVEHCGADFAREVVQDTEAVMAAGGMLTAAGDRLRTKGGVFFYLARGRMSDEVRQTIFPPHTARNRRNKGTKPQQASFRWADRLTVVPALLKQTGDAESVKITLIGRPGKVEMRDELVITTMTHSAGKPTFPRGVPALPKTPTSYTVYIGAKQWKQVESSLDDPEASLVIEGMCAYDPDLQAVAVYANRVTARELAAAKQPTSNGKAAKAEKPAKASAEKAAAPKPATPVADSLVDNLPADVARKLRELNAAADLYREKIASIETQPAGQQFGLEMTQKLLREVEDKISTLEAQHA